MIVEATLIDRRRKRWGFAVSSGILGWVLDAYDFFILIFIMDTLAAHFHVSKSAIVATITATLITRPLGALIFGYCADRWGRRIPLLFCVLYFSIITAITPLAPTFGAFLVLRGLYGIGMGGYWGIGAALVVESCPVNLRGLFSGILQAGYSVGYLLAALLARDVALHFGWRWLFWSGLSLAICIAILTLLSPESYVPERKSEGRAYIRAVRSYWKCFVALTILMTLITCLSHGTQDLYPDFLHVVRHLSLEKVSDTAILYNIGAVFGAILFGRLSDWSGRRNAILLALVLCLCSMPAWVFGQTYLMLAFGSFFMQCGVQGVFGIIPAHLNELAPAAARGLFPGLVYQLGVLFGAPCVMVEYSLRDLLGYPRALATFEGVVLVGLTLLLVFVKSARWSPEKAT